MPTKHLGPHKYYKAKFSKSQTIIYRCGLAGCTHFVYEPLIVNRISICWRCGDEFMILQKSIRNKKIHCEDCTNGKSSSAAKKLIENSINKLLQGIEIGEEKSE